MNNIEYVAVGTLQPYGGNARTHSLKQARGTRATDRVPCPESRTWPIRRRKSSRSPQTIGAEAVLASRTTSVQCDRFVARCVGDRLVSRIPIARSSMPGNDGAETALRGWGGRTRTAESVGIEVRRCCGGISADLAETAEQRRFAFELRRYQRAAAARIWPGVART